MLVVWVVKVSSPPLGMAWRALFMRLVRMRLRKVRSVWIFAGASSRVCVWVGLASDLVLGVLLIGVGVVVVVWG